MMTLELAALSDQSFTTVLDNDRYFIRVFSIGATMACDISRNEVVLMQGMRITDGSFLIPFPYEYVLHGNFLLITKDEALPDYTQFGLTQNLIYLSYAEIYNIVFGTNFP